MGLLTPKQQKEMLLAHGKSFIAVCDECEKLIEYGKLYVVLKWRKDKSVAAMPRQAPDKIRCMDCNDEKLGKKKKEHKEGKPETHDLQSGVRRRVLKIFAKSNMPLDTNALLSQLKRREEFRKLKKTELKETLRAMKQMKELQRRNRVWSVPVVKEKKTRRRKKK